MTTIRVWTMGTFVIIVALLAGGWFLGVQPLLTEASRSDETRLNAEQQNAALESQLASLKVDFAGIDGKRSELAAIRASIPEVADDAGFFTQLATLSGDTGATIDGIDVSDAVEYAPPVPEAEAAPPAEAGATTPQADQDAAASAASGQVAPEPVVPESGTPDIPESGALTSLNFAAVPYAISVSGSIEQTMAFVSKLQTSNRLFLVTKVSTASDHDGTDYTTDISGYTWVYTGLDLTAAVSPVDSGGDATVAQSQ